MPMRNISKWAPVIFPVHFTPGEAVDKQVFTADRDYEVLEVIEVHVAAGAASSTLAIEKVSSGTAPASGTDILATTFALDSTVDTPVHKNRFNGGLASKATRTITRGQSLTVDFTGTITDYEGCITFVLQPVTASEGAQ